MKETHPILTEDKRSFDRHQYPSMDYTGLYKALEKIVNVVPVVEIGVEGMCLDKVDNLCFSQKRCELYTTLIFQFV